MHNLSLSDARNGVTSTKDLTMSSSFWVIYALGAYELEDKYSNDTHDPNADVFVGFAPDKARGTILIFNETIRDWFKEYADEYSMSANQYRQEVTFHEALHCFGLTHDDGGVMTQGSGVGSIPYQSIEASIIQIVQACDQPNKSPLDRLEE